VLRRHPIATILLALVLTSCGGASTPSSAAVTARPSSPSPSGPATSAHPPTIFSGTIPVADGRKLNVRCIGTGTPTVVLEAGGTSSNIDNWPIAFLETIGREATTCYYSRAGGHGSTRIVGGLMTRDQILNDAFTMLGTLRDAHGVQGPYIWVGWSFGGSVALMEALHSPDDSAGLVILDTDFPGDFLAQCAASGRTDTDCRAEYDGDKEAKSIEKDLVANLHPLPNIPLAMVTAMQLPDCHPEAASPVVTANIGGVVLTAPDCDALAAAIADKAKADWGQLGQPVAQTRVAADHDGLVVKAGDQIAEVILGIVRRAP
jgi:pimeloyl-ACP methyl ester carboxylesterase